MLEPPLHTAPLLALLTAAANMRVELTVVLPLIQEIVSLPQQQEEIGRPFDEARSAMSLAASEHAHSAGRNLSTEDALTEAYDQIPA